MVIDLQRASVPGFDFGAPRRTTHPLFDGYANLQRSADAPFYEDYVNRATSSHPVGSIAGGLSLSQALDLSHPDPKRWTSIAPPRSLTGNILGDLNAKATTSTAKLGTFNLNLIDPFSSYQDWTGANVGMTQQPSFAGPTDANPLTTFLNWQSDLPVKLMEKPLALLEVMANRIGGTKTPITADDGQAVYPFQKDPAYWAWLKQASDDQLVQQARAVAGQYIEPGRNEALFNTLMARFREDRRMSSGLSSGNDGIDYTAKTRFTYDLIARANANAPGFSAGDWAKATAGAYDVTAQLVSGLIPFVGPTIAAGVAPIDPRVEAAWATLSQQERSKYLSDAGFRSTILNLVGAVPAFGGLGMLGAAAEASSLPSIAAMGRAWSITLRAANISMALGVVTQTAAWAAESFAPEPIAAFGRDVNLATPLSHSALGGVLNQIGFFASGTFGYGLAVRGAAGGILRAGGAIDRLAGGRVAGVIGTPELPYFSVVYGGSRMTNLFESAAEIPHATTELGVKQSLLSFLVNAGNREVARVYERVAAGESINPEVDALPIEDRYSWADRQVMQALDNQHARVAFWADNINKVRQQLGLLPADDERIALQTLRGGVRAGLEDATRAHLQMYGPEFFGSDLAQIRAGVEARLTEAGYKPDMAALDAELGTKGVHAVESWRQAARLAHQLGYVKAQGELAATLAGSHEQALTLFSQRTLFKQDIEEAIPVLTGDDAAAAAAMVAKMLRKARVAEAYALGEFRDPSRTILPAEIDPHRLAYHLLSILEQAGAPERRVLPDPASPTSSMPLNAFHRRIVDEGAWDLGFRAKAIVAPELRFATYLEALMSPAELHAAEPARFLVRDVQPGEVPPGYIEITAGTSIRRKNWYALDPIYSSDGRYFVKDDGTVHPAGTAAIAPASTPLSRPSLEPGFERPIGVGDEGWDAIPSEQKVLARDPVHDVVGNFDEAPYSWQLKDTGEVLSGRNAGAHWPVLEEDNGTRWLFKARRNPSGGLTDLSNARMLAGVTATKLFKYLGLNTAEEIPFEWAGTKGTLQRMVDVAERVDLARLEDHSPDVQADVVRQHVVDWFTSQHDSNSDSLLIGEDGLVYGIDKGQAYKYVNDPHAGEDAAMVNGRLFWEYAYDAADKHLGEYISEAVARGMPLDRTSLEPTIRAIEDLPDDVFLAALRPLAEARVADGRFEKTVEEFFGNELQRKRSIRIAVNRAFEELGYAGLERAERQMQRWRPLSRGLLDIGTPTRVNEPPLPLEDLYRYNEAHPVDEPPAPDTVDHYKAGVVIQEPDGSLWTIAPLDRATGGSRTPTWPKGRVDAGETFQQAAIREAFEETGISVRLKSHLVDLPNDAGNVTRYYLAERVSGGPQHVVSTNEIGHVILTKGDYTHSLLTFNQQVDARDVSVLDALAEQRAGTHATLEADGPPIDGADAPVTGDPAGEWGYTSHVKLANGAIWRTPWLDVGPAEAAQIELGNRGMLGRAYDDLFQGWKSWRILETQKAQLHYTLTRDYPGFTAEQIQAYFSKLLELQRKAKVPIQAMAGISEHMPIVGHWASEVRAAAEDIFGPGPFLKRDGTYVPGSEMDWNRITVGAFRQSVRLNATAGLTGFIKSMPGIGGVALPISDVIYPIMRFGISPLFRFGEVVESAMLNAMRGTMLSGDPFIDALYYKAGAGNGLGVLLDDMGTDVQLQGLTMLNTVGSPQAKTGSSPFFFERADPQGHAKAVASMLVPERVAPPGLPSSTLGDSLSGDRLEAPPEDIFPDRFAESTPRTLLPTEIDPSTGDVMVDFSGAAQTERQVAAFRDETLGKLQAAMLADPAKAAAYGSAFAFLRSLPAGTIEKLAAHVPYAHTPVVRSSAAGRASKQIGYVEQAIKDGIPMFSGNLSTGRYALEAAAREAGGVAIEARSDLSAMGTSTTISSNEQWVGFADAKYGNAANQYIVSDGIIAILKPQKLADSVTVNTDRINYAHDVQAISEAMMTPRAVDAISRLAMQKLILEWAANHPTLTFLDYLQKHAGELFTDTNPFEMAYMNGINFTDVASVMVPKGSLDRWTALVDQYRDHPNAKGLAELPVTAYDPHTEGYAKPMWANALERAGLTDLGLSFPESGLAGEDALAALPSWTVTPGSVYAIEQAVVSAAEHRIGLQARFNHSDLDQVTIAINRQRLRVKEAQGELRKVQVAKKGGGNLYGYGQTLDDAKANLADKQATLDSLEALGVDVEAFYAKSPYEEKPPVQFNAAVATAEEAWHNERSALTARMHSLAVQPGSGNRKGSLELIHAPTAEIIDRIPYDPQPLESTAPVRHELGTQSPPAADVGYDVIKTRALLDEFQRRMPPGYSTQMQGLFADNAAPVIQQAIDSPHFRGVIKAAAERKLGHSLPGEPVIRIYVRGNGDWLQGHGQPTGPGEAVITVSSAAGQPYGNLTLPELTELWNTEGFPAAFRDRAGAVGHDPGKAGELNTSWGGPVGHLMHGPGPTAEGRLYYYRSRPGGAFEDSPIGRDYNDPAAFAALDTRMAYHFDPAGQSYIDLASERAFLKSGVAVRTTGKTTEVGYYAPNLTYPQWSYKADELTVSGATTAIQTFAIRHLTVQDSREGLVALRDIFERYRPPEGEHASVRVYVGSDEVRSAFERLYTRGEVPDWIVAVDTAGRPIDKYAVVEAAAGTSAGVEALPPEPAASFEEIPGTPEAVTQTLRQRLAAKGKEGKKVADAMWNPTPFKMRAQDKLTFKLVRDTFAPVLKETAPQVAKVFGDLKIPDRRWADFLVHDRYLLARWKESGSRADWEALVQHAARYTGKADYAATRKGLDELYTGPEFETMLETWRLAVKAAEDESYSVHFFSPYRSTFERSINHPLLGVYPASWAFKIAKEWYRFLYQNTTLGFKAGMVPAQIVKNIYNAQNAAWAQSNPDTLDDYYQKGPLSSSIFVFNLLLPGDWSSVPFPFSRTIRDVARGNTNLFDLFSRNMTYMGVGRDIRLLSESAGELSAGGAPHGAFGNAVSEKGKAPVTFQKASSIRDYYTYR